MTAGDARLGTCKRRWPGVADIQDSVSIPSASDIVLETGVWVDGGGTNEMAEPATRYP